MAINRHFTWHSMGGGQGACRPDMKYLSFQFTPSRATPSQIIIYLNLGVLTWRLEILLNLKSPIIDANR